MYTVRSGRTLSSVAAVSLPDEEAEREQEERDELAAQQANWSQERIIAEGLAAKLVQQWQGPISTLARAGKAFEGLEALLGGGSGGGSFDLGVSISDRYSQFIELLDEVCHSGGLTQAGKLHQFGAADAMLAPTSVRIRTAFSGLTHLQFL